MLNIPLTSDPKQQFTATMNGVAYDFFVRYNDMANNWTCDLSLNADGTSLVCGMPLVLGADLLAPYGLGIGSILMLDMDGTSTDAGPDDLGVRVMMFYLTPEEVMTFRG